MTHIRNNARRSSILKTLADRDPAVLQALTDDMQNLANARFRTARLLVDGTTVIKAMPNGNLTNIARASVFHTQGAQDYSLQLADKIRQEAAQVFGSDVVVAYASREG